MTVSTFQGFFSGLDMINVSVWVRLCSISSYACSGFVRLLLEEARMTKI